MSGATFNAGGLMALDRNDRRVLALVARAAERWRRPGATLPGRRGSRGSFDKPVRSSLRSTDRMPPLSACYWREARRPTVVDAHVVVCARRAGQGVVTIASDLWWPVWRG